MYIYINTYIYKYKYLYIYNTQSILYIVHGLDSSRDLLPPTLIWEELPYDRLRSFSIAKTS